jgi:hypothetical protein
VSETEGYVRVKHDKRYEILEDLYTTEKSTVNPNPITPIE